jgi:3-keto-L-gulonate-6-phosphate decarboxylase
MSAASMSAEDEYQESSKQWYNDINFEEIDDDLATFQEDEMVQQALHRGVDLDKYGKELERDLRQVTNVYSLIYQSSFKFIRL